MTDNSLAIHFKSMLQGPLVAMVPKHVPAGLIVINLCRVGTMKRGGTVVQWVNLGQS